jgi:hypothetical protein
MLKSEMLACYHAHNYSTSYTVGFIYSGKVYAISLTTISASWTRREHNGKQYVLRLDLNAKAKQYLIATDGCVCLGAENELLTRQSKYNYGDQFERIIYEAMINSEWSKDFTPWWLGADIETKGAKIQVKFNGATIVKENQLKQFN